MIVASIHWDTDDREQLKKLPSTIVSDEYDYVHDLQGTSN